jgi:predicted RNA-binding protein associated with RNAse of E/G family
MAEEVKVIDDEQFVIITKDYRENNNKKKEIEKVLNKLKPTIKAYVEKNHDSKNDAGSLFLDVEDLSIELRASSKNKSQDEMVALLKSFGRKDCIKTVEVIDEEALETASMAGDITEDQLKQLQFTQKSLYVK